MSTENNNEPVGSIDTNEDLTQYIQTASMADLMKRFGIADENESIRDEEFNPLDGKKNLKKQLSDDERTAPGFKKDPLYASNSSLPSNSFGSAESEFDNDAISFDEINLDALGDITVEPSHLEEDGQQDNNLNAHTRTVFIDERLEDGIKRNADFEVTDVFMNE